MPRFARLAALALGLFAGLPAAADTALLIGNSRYDHAAAIRDAANVAAATRALEGVGFDVIQGRNLTAEGIRDGLSQFLARGETGRIVIALSGHFANAPDGEAWFLGTDADTPDRGDIGGHGVALSTVMALAAEAPGRSVVLLATEDRRLPLGRGLARGIALPEPPQGVAVVAGSPRDISQLLWSDLLEPGMSVAHAVAANDALVARGFLPETLPFLEPPARVDTPAADPAERALWEAAVELDTEGAFRAYLTQYPFGPHAAEARARLRAFEADPARQDEAAEAALNLSRNDRRQIQRDLSVLGHDTRGIDGIFGQGTRTAIQGWQRAASLPATGYLTRAAITRLSTEAAARRAEIEAEEARQRAERERQDRAYWEAVGRGGDAAGLRAYLDRFPQGLYADVARARLDQIEAADRAEADSRAFATAAAADTVAAYRAYLDAYPDGAHAGTVRARIVELQGSAGFLPDPQAEAREAALSLPPATRRLVEQRLAQAGYDPGPIDGSFDTAMRRALFAYQEDAGLRATGYLDRETVLQFLSDGIRIIVQ